MKTGSRRTRTFLAMLIMITVLVQQCCTPIAFAAETGAEGDYFMIPESDTLISGESGAQDDAGLSSEEQNPIPAGEVLTGQNDIYGNGEIPDFSTADGPVDQQPDAAQWGSDSEQASSGSGITDMETAGSETDTGSIADDGLPVYAQHLQVQDRQDLTASLLAPESAMLPSDTVMHFENVSDPFMADHYMDLAKKAISQDDTLVAYGQAYEISLTSESAGGMVNPQSGSMVNVFVDFLNNPVAGQLPENMTGLVSKVVLISSDAEGILTAVDAGAQIENNPFLPGSIQRAEFPAGAASVCVFLTTGIIDTAEGEITLDDGSIIPEITDEVTTPASAPKTDVSFFEMENPEVPEGTGEETAIPGTEAVTNEMNPDDGISDNGASQAIDNEETVLFTGTSDTEVVNTETSENGAEKVSADETALDEQMSVQPVVFTDGQPSPDTAGVSQDSADSLQPDEASLSLTGNDPDDPAAVPEIDGIIEPVSIDNPRMIQTDGSYYYYSFTPAQAGQYTFYLDGDLSSGELTVLDAALNPYTRVEGSYENNIFNCGFPTSYTVELKAEETCYIKACAYSNTVSRVQVHVGEYEKKSLTITGIGSDHQASVKPGEDFTIQIKTSQITGGVRKGGLYLTMHSAYDNQGEYLYTKLDPSVSDEGVISFEPCHFSNEGTVTIEEFCLLDSCGVPYNLVYEEGVQLSDELLTVSSLQAALDELSQVGGGTYALENYSINIRDSITIPENVTLAVNSYDVYIYAPVTVEGSLSLEGTIYIYDQGTVEKTTGGRVLLHENSVYVYHNETGAAHPIKEDFEAAFGGRYSEYVQDEYGSYTLRSDYQWRHGKWRAYRGYEELPEQDEILDVVTDESGRNFTLNYQSQETKADEIWFRYTVPEDGSKAKLTLTKNDGHFSEGNNFYVRSDSLEAVYSQWYYDGFSQASMTLIPGQTYYIQFMLYGNNPVVNVSGVLDTDFIEAADFADALNFDDAVYTVKNEEGSNIYKKVQLDIPVKEDFLPLLQKADSFSAYLYGNHEGFWLYGQLEGMTVRLSGSLRAMSFMKDELTYALDHIETYYEGEYYYIARENSGWTADLHHALSDFGSVADFTTSSIRLTPEEIRVSEELPVPYTGNEYKAFKFTAEERGTYTFYLTTDTYTDSFVLSETDSGSWTSSIDYNDSYTETLQEGDTRYFLIRKYYNDEVSQSFGVLADTGTVTIENFSLTGNTRIPSGGAANETIRFQVDTKENIRQAQVTYRYFYGDGSWTTVWLNANEDITPSLNEGNYEFDSLIIRDEYGRSHSFSSAELANSGFDVPPDLTVVSLADWIQEKLQEGVNEIRLSGLSIGKDYAVTSLTIPAEVNLTVQNLYIYDGGSLTVYGTVTVNNNFYITSRNEIPLQVGENGFISANASSITGSAASYTEMIHGLQEGSSLSGDDESYRWSDGTWEKRLSAGDLANALDLANAQITEIGSNGSYRSVELTIPVLDASVLEDVSFRACYDGSFIDYTFYGYLNDEKTLVTYQGNVDAVTIDPDISSITWMLRHLEFYSSEGGWYYLFPKDKEISIDYQHCKADLSSIASFVTDGILVEAQPVTLDEEKEIPYVDGDAWSAFSFTAEQDQKYTFYIAGTDNCTVRGLWEDEDGYHSQDIGYDYPMQSELKAGETRYFLVRKNWEDEQSTRFGVTADTGSVTVTGITYNGPSVMPSGTSSEPFRLTVDTEGDVREVAFSLYYNSTAGDVSYSISGSNYRANEDITLSLQEGQYRLYSICVYDNFGRSHCFYQEDLPDIDFGQCSFTVVPFEIWLQQQMDAGRERVKLSQLSLGDDYSLKTLTVPAGVILEIQDLYIRYGGELVVNGSVEADNLQLDEGAKLTVTGNIATDYLHVDSGTVISLGTDAAGHQGKVASSSTYTEDDPADYKELICGREDGNTLYNNYSTNRSFIWKNDRWATRRSDSFPVYDELPEAVVGEWTAGKSLDSDYNEREWIRFSAAESGIYSVLGKGYSEDDDDWGEVRNRYVYFYIYDEEEDSYEQIGGSTNLKVYLAAGEKICFSVSGYDTSLYLQKELSAIRAEEIVSRLDFAAMSSKVENNSGKLCVSVTLPVKNWDLEETPNWACVYLRSNGGESLRVSGDYDQEAGGFVLTGSDIASRYDGEIVFYPEECEVDTYNSSEEYTYWYAYINQKDERNYQSGSLNQCYIALEPVPTVTLPYTGRIEVSDTWAEVPVNQRSYVKFSPSEDGDYCLVYQESQVYEDDYEDSGFYLYTEDGQEYAGHSLTAGNTYYASIYPCVDEEYDEETDEYMPVLSTAHVRAELDRTEVDFRGFTVGNPSVVAGNTPDLTVDAVANNGTIERFSANFYTEEEEERLYVSGSLQDGKLKATGAISSGQEPGQYLFHDITLYDTYGKSFYYSAEDTGVSAVLTVISLQDALQNAQSGSIFELGYLYLYEKELTIPQGVTVILRSFEMEDSALTVDGTLKVTNWTEVYGTSNVVLNGSMIVSGEYDDSRNTFYSGKGKLIFDDPSDDYYVSFPENLDYMTATVEETGVNIYDSGVYYWYYWDGSAWKTDSAYHKEDISERSFRLGADEYDFTGNEIEPKVISEDGLTEDEDFWVSYDSNVSPGTAHANIHGMGDYTGVTVLEYTIMKGRAALTAELVGAQETAQNSYETSYGARVQLVASLTHPYGEDVEAPDLVFTSSNPDVAEISGTGDTRMIDLNSTGDTVLTVSAPGTDELEAVERVSFRLTVKKAPQSINVPKKNWTKYFSDDQNGNSFDLKASSSGGSALNYSCDNDDILSVDDSGKVTLKKVGTAVITITAEENDHYETPDEVRVNVKVLAGDGEVKLKQKIWSLGYGERSGDNTLEIELPNGNYLSATGGELKLENVDSSLLEYVNDNINRQKLTGMTSGENTLKVYTAADEEKGYTESEKKEVLVRVLEPEVVFDGLSYISLSSALSHVDEQPALITLLCNTAESDVLHLPSDRAEIRRGQDVTLNLNGYNYNGALRVFGKLILRNRRVVTGFEDMLSNTSSPADLVGDDGDNDDAVSLSLGSGGQLIIEQEENGYTAKVNLEGHTAKIASDALVQEDGHSKKVEQVAYFANVSDAIEAANHAAQEGSGSGGGQPASTPVTVELTDSAVLEKNVSINENVTLNLAGKSLIAADDNVTLDGNGSIKSEELIGGQTSTTPALVDSSLLQDNSQLKVSDDVQKVEAVPEFIVPEQEKHTYDGKSPELTWNKKSGEEEKYDDYVVEPVPGETSVGEHDYRSNVYLVERSEGQIVKKTLVKQLTGKVEIVPAAVEVQISVDDKDYDGLRNAAVECSVTGNDADSMNRLLEEDGVALTASAYFEDESAGDDKAVSVKVQLEKDGEPAENYVFKQEDPALQSQEMTCNNKTANINKASMLDEIQAGTVSTEYNKGLIGPEITVPEGTTVTYAEVKQEDYDKQDYQDDQYKAEADLVGVSEFTSSCPSFSLPGTYYVAYKAVKENFKDVCGIVPVTINRKSIKISRPASFKDTEVEYDGNLHALSLSEADQVDGTTVSYFYDGKPVTGVREAGQYEVTAVFAPYNGNYELTGTTEYSVNLTISGRSIKGATVSGLADQTYNGEGAEPLPVVTLDGKVLSSVTDYDVTYKDNLQAGTATVTVTGKGNYKDTVLKSFVIRPQSISGAVISGLTNRTYNGSAQTQTPVVTLAGKVLSAATDYNVTYASNTQKGTATVTITGKGNYAGTLTGSFVINPASLAGAKISGLKDETFTGKAITQTPVVNLGGKVLSAATDYTVSYSGNVNPGTATVNVTGKGNYTGTVTGTFVIKAAPQITPSVAPTKAPEHIHNWSEWKLTKEATALNEGVETRTCSCGASETRPVAKLTPTMKLNVSGTMPLKKGQTIKSVTVTELAKGDSVASVSSSKKNIVTVTYSGGKLTLKAKKKTGTAKITVTLASGKSSSFNVKVQSSAVKTKKITVASKSITLKKGKSYNLNTVLTPLSSTEKTKYTTKNKKIATVSSNGVIKARKKGKTTITVKSGSKSVKVTVKVVN